MGTVGSNPVKFDAATGRLRAGIEFDAPLTRLAERNNYRQSLIEYNQARRAYYTFVDRVSQSLRGTLRTIDLNQVNFELRRSAVHTALTQVDLARKQLLAPIRPNVEGPIGAASAAVSGSQSGDLGRDLVTALADLTQVQNDFLSVWLNYRVLRMGLDLDLGVMRVDHGGMWIEPEEYDLSALLGEDYCPEDELPEAEEIEAASDAPTPPEEIRAPDGTSAAQPDLPAEEISPRYHEALDAPTPGQPADAVEKTLPAPSASNAPRQAWQGRSRRAS
jgi:hypothetical protein